MKIITPYKNALLNIVLRKILRSKYTFWKIDNRWYVFKDNPNSKATEYINYEISRGFYQPQTHLLPGDIVIDLGAHIGMFSIPLAAKYPSVEFICFEANKENFENLKANIKLNNTPNVFAINRPVGTDGLIVESLMVKDNSGASTVKEATTGSLCIGIDEILKIAGDRLKLLKCDIEGSEYDFFYSKKHWEQIPEIMIELHNKDVIVPSINDTVRQSYTNELRMYKLKDEIEHNVINNKISINSGFGCSEWINGIEVKR